MVKKLEIKTYNQLLYARRNMDIGSIIQIAVLLGLPILWPLLLAVYITKKSTVLFKLKRFAIYSLAGYASIAVLVVFAILFNSWLVSSGQACNYPETESTSLY